MHDLRSSSVSRAALLQHSDLLLYRLFTLSESNCALQDAESTGTEQEADEDRPALRQNLENLAGDWIRKRYGSVDAIIDDKDNLQAMVKIVQKKGQKLQDEAKGTVVELRVEKVC